MCDDVNLSVVCVVMFTEHNIIDCLSVAEPFTHFSCSVSFTHCVRLESLDNSSPRIWWLSCPLPLSKHIGITPHRITGLSIIFIQCCQVNLQLDSNLKPFSPLS